MNKLYYIPFFIFIIAAYFYYWMKGKKLDLYYKTKREEYLQKNSDLPTKQSENISQGIPWTGMETSLLVSLFGEPRRKRVLDQSLTKTIWSYADLFVYIDNDIVLEWKSK